MDSLLIYKIIPRFIERLKTSHDQELNTSVRRRTRLSLIAIIGAIVAFVLVATTTGIIGNRSDNLFSWRAIGSLVAQSGWSWVVTFVVLLASLAVIFYLIYRYRVLNHALVTANDIINLDDSLLRLLASWIPSRNQETEMKRLFAELLRDACAEFVGQVHRAFILTPDSQNSDELTVWAHIGIPPETIEHLKFYIGNDKDRIPMRGVAGEVFLARKLRVVHVIPEKGGWRTDSSNFVKFHLRTGLPAYRSFVCVPIIGPNVDAQHLSTTVSLGVAVFDSMDREIFDRPESQVLLRMFARRIAAALTIGRLLA